MQVFILCLLFYQGGYEPYHIPFHSKEACEKAAAWYEQPIDGLSPMRAVCLEDYIEDDVQWETGTTDKKK